MRSRCAAASATNEARSSSAGREVMKILGDGWARRTGWTGECRGGPGHDGPGPRIGSAADHGVDALLGAREGLLDRLAAGLGLDEFLGDDVLHLRLAGLGHGRQGDAV